MSRRFMGDNVYQLGWFITGKMEEDGTVSHAESLAAATGKEFLVAVQGRVDYIRSVLDYGCRSVAVRALIIDSRFDGGRPSRTRS